MNSENNKSAFWERVKARANSPKHKKITYIRHITAGYIAFFIFLLLLPAYLMEQFIGISSDTVFYTVLLFAVVGSVLIATKKSRQKFKNGDE